MNQYPFLNDNAGEGWFENVTNYLRSENVFGGSCVDLFNDYEELDMLEDVGQSLDWEE